MPNLKLKIPKDIQDIHKLFKKNGKKLFIVGGAVRDAILGKSPKDIDLATDAVPDDVLRIVQRAGYTTVGVGKQFGVIVVQTKQSPDGHEIATFRKDLTKGRRPDAVDFTDIKGDVKRRDLTINALFYDLDRNEIVDLVGGISDLKNKQIRTVGNPTERFDEDPLRKLRALRFAGLLKGTIGKETYQALKDNPSLSGVSTERIRDEFIKGIIKSKSTKKYFKFIDDLGFWKEIFPGLIVSSDYIDSNDYEIQLAWLLRKNRLSVVKNKLNRLKYSVDESRNVLFLLMLLEFEVSNIFVVKKAEESISLSSRQLKRWGSIIGRGNDISNIVKFKLSVKGEDVMKAGIKGPAVGAAIRSMESDNFRKMNENRLLVKNLLILK